MKKMWGNTLWAVVVIFVFIGGVAAGTYYHDEILVWWRAIRHLPTATVPAAAMPTPLPNQSVIALPGLDQALPLIYSDTLEEEKIQEYLTQGAVVLPLGTSFGEKGNMVVTAHSSGSQAFGPYRFAFAKLADLEAGQEYTIQTPAARYTYKVYGKEVVWPHEVNKLPNDDRSTVTLVTCWPLWTNFKRLLVHAELVKTEYRI